MPGRPGWHEFLAQIETRGGEEWFLEQVMNGVSLLRIARECGFASRALPWRYANETEARRAEYDKARRVGAGAYLDQATEIADGADEHSPAGVQKAKLQVDIRKALAAFADPEQFGASKPGTQVNISIGELHLDALRQRGGPGAALPQTPPSAPVIQDVEVKLLPPGKSDAPGA